MGGPADQVALDVDAIANVTASTKKGSEKAIAIRKPPSGGPMNVFASAACTVGMIERITPSAWS